MKKLIVLILAVGLIGGGVAVLAIRSHQPKPAPAAKKTVPKPNLNPLEIEAIRGRSYPGSPITLEQQLGDQGGYTNSIVSYRSDGLKVYALVSTPNTPKPSGGYPVIIFNHGYIPPTEYITDGPEYASFIAAYARAGFVVVKPDYRGHGKSQGVAEGGHYSPAYVYDVLNLVSSLKQYDQVNPKKIGMLGHSMGGHVTLRAVVTSPDIKASVFAAGVVGSMYDLFYNWPRSPVRTDQPQATIRTRMQELIKQQGTPKDNPDFWNRASAINYAADVKGPVQIDYGTADTVVPPLFSIHLDEALKKAGRQVQAYSYEGGDHQFTSTRELFLERSIEFFRHNLS